MIDGIAKNIQHMEVMGFFITTQNLDLLNCGEFVRKNTTPAGQFHQISDVFLLWQTGDVSSCLLEHHIVTMRSSPKKNSHSYVNQQVSTVSGCPLDGKDLIFLQKKQFSVSPVLSKFTIQLNSWRLFFSLPDQRNICRKAWFLPLNMQRS